MMKIPPNNKWSQNSKSDVFGSLFTSWNLDLTTNTGKTRVSPRTVITTDDITNLGVASGFVRFNAGTAGYFTVAGATIFNSASVDPSSVFADSGSTLNDGSSDTSDIIFFSKANTLAVSANTFLEYYTSSWASVGTPTLTSGTVHMMCEYGNRLYLTDNFKTIVSYNTSMTGTATGNPNTFSLGTLSANNVGYRIIDILAASDKIWILTATSQLGQPAKIYTWDGATQDDPTNEYILDTSGIVAGIIKDDTLYVMTVEAELLVFNGGSFTRVENARLPVNSNKFLKNSFSSLNDRWIHPRGITVSDDGKINILINNVYEDDTVEERLPSGIWEFDLNNKALGWYHIASLSLYTSTVTDYGQNRVSRVGALTYVKTPNKDGLFLVGAQLYSNASSTKEVIMTNNTDDDIQKYGYAVTTKIYSSEIEDSWNIITARIKPLLSATDKIVLKYRFVEETATSISITWVNTTSFTTTTDVSAMVGDEVEVLQGTGSGKCAHIVSVTGSGTYTVTVDETFTGVTTGTAKARVVSWVKLGPGFSKQNMSSATFPIGRSATWIQIKICLQFTGKDELDDLVLVSKPHQLAQ